MEMFILGLAVGWSIPRMLARACLTVAAGGD